MYMVESLASIFCEFIDTKTLSAFKNPCKYAVKGSSGGEGGIRTPGRGFSPYNGLANRRLQPLGHLSVANRRNIIAYTFIW